MFIKTHTDTISDEKIVLTFIKSTNIQAFPCGHRRSTDVSGYRIPFDPEARLNTEANNRKHSSLNGYTQTYLDNWDTDNKLLTLALAGYLFSINLDTSCSDSTTFGAIAYDIIKAKSAEQAIAAASLENDDDRNAFILEFNNAFDENYNHLYANILINDTQLFVGSPKNYNTSILGSQSNSADISAIDLLASGTSSDVANYYFSGLSFSVKPLATLVRAEEEQLTFADLPFQTRDEAVKTSSKQRVVSLCILDKVLKEGTTEYEWKIHEPAKLPRIEHGDLEDSIVVGETLVRSNLTVENDAVIKNYLETTTLEVVERSSTKDLGVSGLAIINKLDVNVSESSDADITANTIEVTDNIKAPELNVTTTLQVHNETTPAEAKMDKAIIAIADIAGATIEATTEPSSDSISELSVTKVTVANDKLKITNDSTNALVEVDELKATSIIATDLSIDDNIEAKSMSVLQTLNVQAEPVPEGKTPNPPAVANIDKANIDKANITKLDVLATEETDTGIANISKANITVLNVQQEFDSGNNPIKDTGIADINTANIESAKIKTLAVESDSSDAVGELKAEKITQNGRTVPYITLTGPESGFYQLQITLDPSKKITT
jgi:hypothetical protein